MSRRQERLSGLLSGLAPLTLVLLLPLSAQAGVTRYVNNTDITCREQGLCYSTIQAAVNAAQSGDRIVTQAGTYAERVTIQGKNNFNGATESLRIIIETDPAAPPGSVVVRGATHGCANGEAFRFLQSRFITLRGFTIAGAGGQAISLLGGNKQNQAIHIERNRLFDNGSESCNGGITVAAGNPDTLIVNNLIYGNGRIGVAFVDADGGPHYVVNNTIDANGWNGIDAAQNHAIFVVNNVITANGSAIGSSGGRYGVRRESSKTPSPEGIHLLNNLICGNRLGEVNGPALDATDSANLTPTGTEGYGVSASPGCQTAATVYTNVNGRDGIALTADDDFTPAPASPVIDRGMDPRTLGLDALFNPIFLADFSQDAVRPAVATATGSFAFDLGAVELTDAQPPAISMLQPLGGASLRGNITLRAQAIDTESGVASVVFSVDNQALGPMTNSDPARPFTASTLFDTTSVPDGIHTLAATAIDRAANLASTLQSFIVDNTPPDTRITVGPSGEITAEEIAFVFTGTDNLTPASNLLFAWRLDDGAYTAFTGATAATLRGLAHGNHTFDVKARDRAGNVDPTPATRAFSVSELRVAITDPVPGATVAPGPLLVTGTVQAAGAEVAVTVNGITAAVQGTAFAVLVPLASGTATLTATAMTAAGATSTQSITVTAAAASTFPLTLRPNPTVGVAPLPVTFSVSGDLTPASIELDYDGDGTVDFSGPTPDGQVFTYDQPGLYFPRATITDTRGNRVTATALVQVYDLVTFDAALQSKWTTLKDALRRGDISRALDAIALTARDGYRDLLTALTIPLTQIDPVLTDVSFVALDEGRAEYQMIRVDDGVALSHFILFVQDADGIWRLKFF
jgi:hypothetical protein